MASPTRPASRRSEEPLDSPLADSQARADKASKRRPPPPSETGAVDLIIAGTAIDADLLTELRSLENAGILRVGAWVHRSDEPNPRAAEFPAVPVHPSLDDVAAPPGALVLLASPPRLHLTHANAAFRRGWHVLATAPLAIHSRDAATIIASANRHERTLAVDLHRRFYPAAVFLRSLCRDHLLGPVVNVTIHEGAPLAPGSRPRTPGRRTELPDGALTDLGAPIFDLLDWCFGAGTLVSYADDAMGGVEANAIIQLRFPDQVPATVHLSRERRTGNSWQVVFERGIVRWSVAEANRLTVQLASAPSAVEGLLLPPLTPDGRPARTPALNSKGDAMAAQLRHVVAAIAGREPLRVGAPEALRTLDLLEACHNHRQLLEQPWLTHNERAHAKSLSTPTEIHRP